MKTSIAISELCCALLEHSSAGKYRFLGTAFYFTRNGRTLAATAAHCVPESSRESLSLAPDSTSAPIRSARVLVLDRRVDVCVLAPETAPDGITMKLSEESSVSTNAPLLTCEYSTTEFKNGSWHLNPATRLGNCTRHVQHVDRFGPGGIDMLELSFPAIRGASGAPVIELVGSIPFVRGIVVANNEHHLLPAHIETVLSDDNQLLEERKYFLPQAVAVHVKHLVHLVDSELRERPGGWLTLSTGA